MSDKEEADKSATETNAADSNQEQEANGGSAGDGLLSEQDMADAMAEAIAASVEGAIDDTAKSEPVSMPEVAASGMLDEPATENLDLLNDVELNVRIELGRAEMTVENILRLTNGSVVELDKLAGDPVDVLVNEQLIARGEVLVVNDNFCVRINEILLPGVSEKLTEK